MAAPQHIKPPLKARLKAWWEGYELAKIAKPATASKHPPPNVKIKKATPRLASLAWNETRVKVCQYIWGEGYCGPGGPEHVIGLSKLLALSPEMSMLVLGAGLGGPARILAQEFGAWVTGYETSDELAKAGMELSTMAGLGKKAPILHYDPGDAEPFDRNFDRALSKDHLYTVENKVDLMRQVNTRLKTGGLFVITDYTISAAAVRDKATYKSWEEQEPQPVFLITQDEEAQILKSAGFSIHVNEDISEHYISLISRAWADIDEAVSGLMQQGDEGKPAIEALLREAEYWALCSKMMSSGDLQMIRILASKNTSSTLF